VNPRRHPPASRSSIVSSWMSVGRSILKVVSKGGQRKGDKSQDEKEVISYEYSRTHFPCQLFWKLGTHLVRR
jgi:hypothetical protein